MIISYMCVCLYVCVCDWICENEPCTHKNWNPFYNSLTQALSRHSDTIAIDQKVCFYRWLFADPIKPHKTNTDPVGTLGCINRVACDPKLFHLMSAPLMVWSGLLWPRRPTVHTNWSAVPTGIVNQPTHPLHPPTHPPFYMQHLWYCRLCSNISQNQPVHPVAM